MGRNDCMNGIVLCIIGDFGHGRDFDAFRRWTSQRGGSIVRRLEPSVTHCVISDDEWTKRPRSKTLKDAIQHRDTHLVNWEWFAFITYNNRVDGGKTPKAIYDFRKKEDPVKAASKDDGQPAKKGRKTDFSADRTKKQPQKKGVTGSKATKALSGSKKRSRSDLINGFLEHADELAPRAPKRPKGVRPPSGLMAEDVRDFHDGKKAARTELLTNDYHVYHDQYGFPYEVRLFKTQMEFNYNQQLILMIYEHDTNPNSYAVTARRAGSFVDEKDSHVSVASNGTPFATAFRSFKDAFLEYTGVDWDARSQFPMKRGKAVTETKSNGMITPAQLRAAGGARHGALGKTISEAQKSQFLKDFFKYRNPPAHMPQGAKIPRQHFDMSHDSEPIAPVLDNANGSCSTHAVAGADTGGSQIPSSRGAGKDYHQAYARSESEDGEVMSHGNGRGDGQQEERANVTEAYEPLGEDFDAEFARSAAADLHAGQPQSATNAQMDRGDVNLVGIGRGAEPARQKAWQLMLKLPQQPRVLEVIGRNPITQAEELLDQMAMTQAMLKSRYSEARST